MKPISRILPVKMQYPNSEHSKERRSILSRKECPRPLIRPTFTCILFRARNPPLYVRRDFQTHLSTGDVSVRLSGLDFLLICGGHFPGVYNLTLSIIQKSPLVQETTLTLLYAGG